MKDDLISIIVPVYNVEEYIRTCLKSLQNQTYKNIEIIIVNDASTDRSGNICDDFVSRELRAEIIHRRENIGPARSRNIALRRAKGKYVVFVDGDDRVKPNFIEKLHKEITLAEADIAVCGYVSKQIKHAAPEGVMTGLEAAVRLLSRQQNEDIVVWNKMYKSKLFREVHFAEARAYEDNLTTYKYYAAAKKVVYINNSLYFYNVRPDSIMARSDTYTHLSAKLKAAREAQKYFARRNVEIGILDPSATSARASREVAEARSSLCSAAEFAEALAMLGFIDKSLKHELDFKYYDTYRTKLLKLKKPLSQNPYVTTRVKWYLRLLTPLDGFIYRVFRHFVS